MRKRRDELSLQELNCVLKKNGLFLPLTLYIFSKSWSIFKIKGQFLNPQNIQIPKLSQIFKIDQDLLEISLVKGSNYNIAQFFVDTVYINIRIGSWEMGKGRLDIRVGENPDPHPRQLFPGRFLDAIASLEP